MKTVFDRIDAYNDLITKGGQVVLDVFGIIAALLFVPLFLVFMAPIAAIGWLFGGKKD